MNANILTIQCFIAEVDKKVYQNVISRGYTYIPLYFGDVVKTNCPEEELKKIYDEVSKELHQITFSM